MTFPGWDRRLLLALGGRADPEPLRFIRAWQKAEGGTAEYNPLNTTFRTPGSRDYNQSAHVQHYPDELAGLAATLLTLRLPYYARLVAALKNPSLNADAILGASTSALRTWGTNPVTVAQVLRVARR